MKDRTKNIDKKSLIFAGIFIISIIIIMFGGALIYNKFFYKKSYSEVETIMLTAAQEHFNKNKEKLPKNINDTITLTDETLVKHEEMNTIDSYIKNKNVTCSGKVIVTNINGDYRYTSLLDCGDAYKTKTLTEYIDENVEVVTSGNGLYNLNNELVYRGDDVNNYLLLNDNYYRIVKFKDGRPVIIYTEKSEAVEWDNRYNIKENDNSGINDYEISRMREYLNRLYKNNGESALLTPTTRLLVTQYDLAIGKRSKEDADKTGRLETAKVLTEQYIGLLPVNDFLNASTDKNCINVTSQSCSNYNYLNKYKSAWWSITADSKSTNKAYQIKNIPSLSITSNYASIRPVLYLAKDAIYVSGDGSSANPFIIK